MIGDQRRLAFTCSGSCFEVAGNLAVKRLAPASWKTFVGGFLHQGMVETERAVFAAPGFEDQAGLAQPRKGRSQITLICTSNRRERCVRELPAQDRGNLGNL